MLTIWYQSQAYFLDYLSIFFLYIIHITFVDNTFTRDVLYIFL